MAKKKQEKTTDFSNLIKDIKKSINIDQDSKPNIPSIIDFIYKKEWLGFAHYDNPLKLFPMQEIMLKTFYRGSPGNENLELTEEEIKLIKSLGFVNEDNGDILSKWDSQEIFRELVLVWGRRCLSEDTKIVNAQDGNTYRLGDLWNNGQTTVSTWTYDQDAKKMRIISDCDLIYNGIKQVYLITTTSGHSIEVTSDHPFLTPSGWRMIKDIKKGEKIALARSVPLFGNDKSISESEASLLGYLSSSKFVVSKNSIEINNLHNTVFNDFCEKLKESTEYNIEHIKSINNYQYIISYNSGKHKTSISVSNAINFSNKKYVPTKIVRSEKNILVKYLKSLFSSDGYISKLKNKYSINIVFSVNNLAKEIQDLLRKFGIFSTINSINLNNEIKYKLSISDTYDIKTYINEIGFVYSSNEIWTMCKDISTYRDKERKDLVFANLNSCIKIGIKRCFDISVSKKPHLQNFTADGFIVHNCGKGFTTSIIPLYETMKLLEAPNGNPYALYGLSTAAPFTIITIANAAEQAQHLFREIKDKVMSSQYFRDKLDTNNQSADTMLFLTPMDKSRNIELASRGLQPLPGSIKIYSGHSNSDSLAGMSCFCLLLDEIGLYKNTAGSSSGDAIYNTLAPAVKTYMRKVPQIDTVTKKQLMDENGNLLYKSIFDGKIICISSPRAKEGIFFDLYSKSAEVKHRFMLRAATWVVNPRFTEQMLRDEFSSTPDEKFRMEWGAEFSGTGGESFFPRDAVEKCFSNKNVKEINAGLPGVVYFVHLDPASSSHNYALIVCHKENFYDVKRQVRDFRIIVDHIRYWSPQPNKLISVSEVDNYVISLNARFHFGLVTYDQWSSAESILKLRKIGIPAMETKFNRNYKMAIYDNLYQLVISGKLHIPQHNMLKNEMINLQRKWTSGSNGYKVLPKSDADVNTDDLVDALAGACYNAIDSSVSKLPQGKLINLPVSPGWNTNRAWNGPSGPQTYGSPGQAAKQISYWNERLRNGPTHWR